MTNTKAKKHLLKLNISLFFNFIIIPICLLGLFLAINKVNYYKEEANHREVEALEATKMANTQSIIAEKLKQLAAYQHRQANVALEEASRQSKEVDRAKEILKKHNIPFE